MDGNSEKVNAWLDHLRVDLGRAPATVRKYGDNMGKFLAFLEEGGLSVDTIDRKRLKEFTGMWLHKHGLRSKTRCSYVSSTKGFFEWLCQTGQRADDPAAGLPIPSYGSRLPNAMQLDAAQALIMAPDCGTFMGVRDAAIIAVLLGCGLRASGVSALNTSSLVFEADDKGDEQLYLRVVEKGDRERFVPADPNALLMIRAYLGHPELETYDRLLMDGDKVLFVSVSRNIPECDYRGEAVRMTRRAIYNVVRRNGRKAGIDDRFLHPHALRHLFATELVESGVELNTVQMAMGHADIKSTQRYIHMAKRKLAAEMGRANPLAKIRTPVSDLLGKLRG